MTVEKIKELMRGGDVAAARVAAKALAGDEPGNIEARALYGVCSRLAGDDGEFVRVDDEIAAMPGAPRSPVWRRYHAMRVAACGSMLLLPAAADMMTPVMKYGGPPFVDPVLVAPKPAATDGKYPGKVKITWKKVSGAAKYKIRRATSSDYSKSKTIATVTKTAYSDKHPACKPKKRYYYWIVPCNAAGRPFKSKKRFDAGYAKQALKITTMGAMDVGGSLQLEVEGGPCDDISPEACKWRIVSGASCATLSKKGLLKARRMGRVVVSAAYRGAKAKTVIEIGVLRTLYGGPPFVPVAETVGIDGGARDAAE
ncbi:MAG: hypothetical protein J6T01_02170 [Kiritimatiellae bacterium]|nr:hypothetical protein [Kiritimatiellia bacterium]